MTAVHSRFYELSSDYYKLQGDHANYYREALRFLGCIDVSQLPKERQYERAYSLSLAALLGKYVHCMQTEQTILVGRCIREAGKLNQSALY